SVGHIAIQQLDASAHTRAGKLLVELALRSGAGNTSASLETDMRWGNRPGPELERRGVARLSARGFQLETLSPLLGDDVSELAGVLDAETQLRGTPADTQLSGQARLAHGVVQLPQIGQRFSEIEARVAVRDNRFTLERLEARGLTGRVTVVGAAQLDGFALRAADARVAIKK